MVVIDNIDAWNATPPSLNHVRRNGGGVVNDSIFEEEDSFKWKLGFAYAGQRTGLLSFCPQPAPLFSEHRAYINW